MATGNDIELKGLSSGGGKGKQQKLFKERSVVDKKTLQLLQQLVPICHSGTRKQLRPLLKQLPNDINRKFQGTTLLHEACCHGNQECIKLLLSAEACPTIWDVRGFTAAHCTVYNKHLQSLKLLLDFIPSSTPKWPQVSPDCSSKHEETLLHIACMRGHVEIAQYLVSSGANTASVDHHGNSALHYAVSSDSGVVVRWLLDQWSKDDITNGINTRNKFGQTAAHRACILNCPASLSVLIHYNADQTLQDMAGYTPVDLARLLGNSTCYKIGCGQMEPHPPPLTPAPYRGSISKSMDNLSSSGRFNLSQKSLSNASIGTPPLQRQPSITGMSRPRNLSIIRQPSTSKTSLSSMDDALYITKTTALQVRSSFRHKKTRSWDNTQQLLYNSTAYEPPPDILFVQPISKYIATHDNTRFYSESHGIKISVSPDFWPPQKQPPDQSKLHANVDTTPSLTHPELCVCAAMHLNQPFPPGYTVVSPVYFISCKSVRNCQVEVTLPHAVAFTSEKQKNRICILSTTTVNSNIQPDLWSPSDRTLTELPTEVLKVDTGRVKFRLSLVHPSLYAVAVNERDFPLEPHLPLRCSLFVSYPVLEGMASVSGFFVTAYLGMQLKTVHTAVTNQTSANRSRFEEKHFTLTGEGVRVDAGLTNEPQEWGMTSKDSGEFSYRQLALTQETDKDSYSHRPAYPPQTQFFVEPQGVAAAVKCRVRVLSSEGKEISFIKVIPFSPIRDLTPPPTHSTQSMVLPPHFTLDAHTLATTV